MNVVQATQPGYADGAMADAEIVFSVSESPEGGYEARALDHSIFTQAETLDELRTALQDAVRCHFDEAERPSLIRLQVGGTGSSLLEAAARSFRHTVG